MNPLENQRTILLIQQFFQRYAENFNVGLVNPKQATAVTVASFTGYFVEASPQGVRGGKNGWLFRILMKWGYRRYRKMGVRKMELLRQEVTMLNNMHAMNRISWRCTYMKDSRDGVIDFENTYFVQIVNSKCKIFAYITEDEQKALKEHGLID